MGTNYDYTYTPTFGAGDHIKIVRSNRVAKLPDDECSFAGDFPASMIGQEFIIDEDEMEYDGDDNSWEIEGEWVHEGAMELVRPLTQEEEDDAIASILRSTATKEP
jgi:hypothetical protein